MNFDRGGQSRMVGIVGHDESDPAAGRIAFSAPLARAMIGAEAGDEVELAEEPIAITAIEVA